MKVSPPFPRAYVVRLADGKTELTGILGACELECSEPEVAHIFRNAIEQLFYSESLHIGKAVLPQRRVRSRLHLLDGMILRTAKGELYADLERDVKNSAAYTMAVLFNYVAESENDLLIDPYLSSLRALSEGR